MVLPLIPLPTSAITGRATIRSMLEFFAWFEDMPEAESKLLSETREHYVKLYMTRIGDGPGWCDDRQSFKLPISLSGNGKSTYKSRRWGARPENILAFNSETEKYWVSLLIDNLNKDLATDLSLDLSFLRKGADIRYLKLSLSKFAMVVGGASNANRTAIALAERNVPVTNLAKPGWKITAATEADRKRLLRELGRFRRAVSNLVSNLVSRKKMEEKVKTINPLEAIGVKDDLCSIE